MDLTVDFAGVHFKNPIVPTSGTFGNGVEYQQFFKVEKLGGIALKAITLEPREGNPSPRVCETEAGMINSIGLQNEGWTYFENIIYPKLNQLKTNIIANIAANSIDEYVTLIKKLSPLENIKIIELNVSCPNIDSGEIHFGANETLLGKLIHHCRKESKKPLMVKLSPNVTSIVNMAKVCEQAGADALSLVNTFVGMRIDVDNKKPMIKKIMGGYSGTGIKPIALRMVYEVSQKVNLPILGIGGVSKWQDAIEFLLAGATLVGVGTANLIDPKSAYRILKGVKRYCEKQAINTMELRRHLKVDF